MFTMEFGPGVMGDAVLIQAPAEKIWHLITTPETYPEWNPQCQHMKIISDHPSLMVGARTENTNDRNGFEWTSHSEVIVCNPYDEFTIQIDENGMVWSYKLVPQEQGILLVEVRDSNFATRMQKAVIEGVFEPFGGLAEYDKEIAQLMSQSLIAIQRLAQSS